MSPAEPRPHWLGAESSMLWPADANTPAPAQWGPLDPAPPAKIVFFDVSVPDGFVLRTLPPAPLVELPSMVALVEVSWLPLLVRIPPPPMSAAVARGDAEFPVKVLSLSDNVDPPWNSAPPPVVCDAFVTDSELALNVVPVTVSTVPF